MKQISEEKRKKILKHYDDFIKEEKTISQISKIINHGADIIFKVFMEHNDKTRYIRNSDELLHLQEPIFVDVTPVVKNLPNNKIELIYESLMNKT